MGAEFSEENTTCIFIQPDNGVASSETSVASSETSALSNHITLCRDVEDHHCQDLKLYSIFMCFYSCNLFRVKKTKRQFIVKDGGMRCLRNVAVRAQKMAIDGFHRRQGRSCVYFQIPFNKLSTIKKYSLLP